MQVLQLVQNVTGELRNLARNFQIYLHYFYKLPHFITKYKYIYTH